MLKQGITLTILFSMVISALAADPHVLSFKGTDGPGNGKKIVLLSGDEEYRTEESLPMLAKIFSRRHGFDTSVVFSWDESGRYIDPNNQHGIRGLAALGDADLLIVGTRFRNLSEHEAKQLSNYLNAGKPVIGIRTSTHAFRGKGKFGENLPYDAFGLKILGEKWAGHHGAHKKQGTRSVVETANAGHPILSGVEEITGPTDVYGVANLTPADTILLRGAVTETLEPDSKPVSGKANEPMMPIAWLHTYTSPDNTTKGNSFCTTMGASIDFADPDLRRLIVNAAYHLTGLKVPADAAVEPVDPYYPAFYGFFKGQDHWKNQNLTTESFALGSSPTIPDPEPSPALKHRPRPDLKEYNFQSLLSPVPPTAKFYDPEYEIWGGSAVKGDDGKYHMFYSRWLRKLTHEAWVTHSEIAHAVSDTPFGPWKHSDVSLPPRGGKFWDANCTHNPTIMRAEGRYYLYYMGNRGDGTYWDHRNNQCIGVAVADSPFGPWTRFDEPVINISEAPDALMIANPTVIPRPEGGYLMIYKAASLKGELPKGGPVIHLVATADTPAGPFKKTYKEVFGKEGVHFPAEDPYMWYAGDRYWAIVKDFQGNFTKKGTSLALFESKDGFTWKTAKHPFVSSLEIHWKDQGVQKVSALERPQLLVENGVPIALFCAAAENKERVGTFNVQIPLKASGTDR
ncbi:ThuA domain-containing protein [Luteolibacter algae]|uniref:ThuA domain-containing protein n=1 Tax=Luteolibacter algae TaxID=454151 RepID=A0ABW5D982_9BACT